jgi:hypothetical protein
VVLDGLIRVFQKAFWAFQVAPKQITLHAFILRLAVITPVRNHMKITRLVKALTHQVDTQALVTNNNVPLATTTNGQMSTFFVVIAFS